MDIGTCDVGGYDTGNFGTDNFGGDAHDFGTDFGGGAHDFGTDNFGGAAHDFGNVGNDFGGGADFSSAFDSGNHFALDPHLSGGVNHFDVGVDPHTDLGGGIGIGGHADVTGTNHSITGTEVGGNFNFHDGGISGEIHGNVIDHGNGSILDTGGSATFGDNHDHVTLSHDNFDYGGGNTVSQTSANFTHHQGGLDWSIGGTHTDLPNGQNSNNILGSISGRIW